MTTSEPQEPQQPVTQPDPTLAARTAEAQRIYARMEAARARFYDGSYDDNPAEGQGALAWGLLSLSFVFSLLAVWALYQAAHGGGF